MFMKSIADVTIKDQLVTESKIVSSTGPRSKFIKKRTHRADWMQKLGPRYNWHEIVVMCFVKKTTCF